MNILWIKTGPLYPLDTGGKKRTHNMLCEIVREHHVVYVALKDGDASLDPLEEDAAYAHEKVWVPWREARRGSIRFFGELLMNLVASSRPYTLAKYHSRAFTETIDRLCEARQFDLIVCDFLFPAPNLRDPESKPPTVLFQHNMEAQIWKRMADGKRNPVARWFFRNQFRRMARWEERLSRQFSGIITVSPEDSKYARESYHLDNVVGDVPTGVDTSYFAPAHMAKSVRDAITVGFLGSMDWMPNIEAVQWFVREILPLVKVEIDGVRLLVIGRRPPASVRAFAEADSSIEVTGTVEDIRPYLERSDLLVVPLLSGGGTRIKIMEALAAELPVVSTSVGAEGLGLVDGEHILIGDSAARFAECVCRLAGDPDLRESLGRNGARLVDEHHGWSGVTDVFLQHCKATLEAGSPAGCASREAGTVARAD